MKRILLFAGLAGLVGLAASLRRDASMHEHDWTDFPAAPRRYRSPAQGFHHTVELLGMTPTLAGIYLGRTMTPAFREQVMIVTARTNACPP